MFSDDYREPPIDDADQCVVARPEPRCRWCETYFNAVESDAEQFERFCSLVCEDKSRDAERVR